MNNQGTGIIELSDLRQHPLLRADKLTKIMTSLPKSGEFMPLGRLIPMVEEPTERVEMDVIAEFSGGMTPAVAEDAATPLAPNLFARSRRSFEAVPFREKDQITADDVRKFRQVGTREILKPAEAILRGKIRKLSRRLDRREESLRHGVIFDKAVVIESPQGIAATVPYPHPEFLRPLASPLWDAGTADPIDDLIQWNKDLKQASAYRVKRVILPHEALQFLTRNDRFREWADRNLSSFKGTESDIQGALSLFLGSAVTLEMNDDKINYTTMTTTAMATGTNTVTVLSATKLVAGMHVMISDRLAAAPEVERFTVATVTPNVDGTSTLVFVENAARDFNINCELHYGEYIIPENKILMWAAPDLPLPEADQGEFDMIDYDPIEQPIQLVSTLDYYNDMFNPSPGRFGKLLMPNEQDDPKRIEYVVGEKVLPRVNYAMAWSTPQIFA